MAKSNEWITRDILLEIYTRTGSIHRTAEELQVGSTTITRLFKKFDINYIPRKDLPLIGLRGVPKSEDHKAKLKVNANGPERKELQRKLLIERLPTIGGSSKNSPLEKLLDTQLHSAKLSFIAQKVLLGKYIVDFLLYDYPIIIEADGSIHRLPRNKVSDAKRDAELNEAGYFVYRFNGTEINKSPAECINKIINYIESQIKSGIWNSPSNFTATYLEVKGKNHPSFGKRRTAESIEKQRQKLIGRTLSAEHVDNIRKALKGKPKPEGTGDKISASKIGHSVSDETREKISNTLKKRKADKFSS